LVDLLVEHRLGVVNTDDQNFLEFAFARSVGENREVDDDLTRLGRRLRLDRPQLVGTLDESLLLEERLVQSTRYGVEPHDPSLEPLKAVFGRARSNPAAALAAWRKLGRQTPRTFEENEIVARLAAHSADPEAERFLAGLSSEAQREILRGSSAFFRGDMETATEKLEHAFVLMREDPWVPKAEITLAFGVLPQVSKDKRRSARLFSALDQPFAVEAARGSRIVARMFLARSADDFERCRTAVNELGTPPWAKDVLVARADCLRQVGDPRAEEAEEEAYSFLAHSHVIGETIETPAPPPH
jgi:hypothetical protein